VLLHRCRLRTNRPRFHQLSRISFSHPAPHRTFLPIVSASIAPDGVQACN
jgi:hypothetical protein